MHTWDEMKMTFLKVNEMSETKGISIHAFSRPNWWATISQFRCMHARDFTVYYTIICIDFMICTVIDCAVAGSKYWCMYLSIYHQYSSIYKTFNIYGFHFVHLFFIGNEFRNQTMYFPQIHWQKAMHRCLSLFWLVLSKSHDKRYRQDKRVS